MEAFVGLDFGTSGARAVAISAAGEVLADARQDCDLGEPDSWRAALFGLLAGLPPGLRRRTMGIAIAGTSGTVLPCDSGNMPIAPPLPYHDARAVAQARRLAEVAPAGHIVLAPSSSLAKLLWLEDAGLARGAAWLAHQADWLASLLTGRGGASDYHNALRSGYDPARLAYPDWVRRLPAARLLPAVVAPGTRLGPVTEPLRRALGLPRACLVRAGTTDSVAAFIAASVGAPGTGVTSLGSTLVVKLLSERRVDDVRYGVYSHRLGDRWLAGGASNSGGTVLRQFFDEAELAALSARIDPERPTGLAYYPLPARGERFPVCDPDMMPVMEPRPADPVRFLQALLEGMAEIEARGYRVLAELGATPVRQVLTAGGGADNAAWRSLRAARLGVPVAAARHTEAAYGAARLAAGALPIGDTPLA